MSHISKLISTDTLPHNQFTIRVEKPSSMQLKPGQKAKIAINLPDWKQKAWTVKVASTEDDKLRFIAPSSAYFKEMEALKYLRYGDELLISQ